MEREPSGLNHRHAGILFWAASKDPYLADYAVDGSFANERMVLANAAVVTCAVGLASLLATCRVIDLVIEAP